MKKVLLFSIIAIPLIITLTSFDTFRSFFREVQQQSTRKTIVKNESILPLPQTDIPTNQPRKTNSWFSNAYTFPSEPLFALPGSYKVTTQGVEISAPLVSASEKTVFGSHVPWCTIGPENGSVTSSQVNYYGDWDVNLSVYARNQEITAHLVQGMPIATFTSSKPVSVNCAKVASLSNGWLKITERDLTVYIQAKNGSCTATTGNSYTCTSSENIYRSVILPQNASIAIENVEWFTLSLTSTHFEYADSTITQTLFLEGENTANALTTLWPHHQTLVGDSYESLGTYASSRGPLTLIKSDRITVPHQSPSLPLSFTAVTDPQGKNTIQAKLRLDIDQYLKETPPEGVYFKGTWLGALTSLIQLNQLYGTAADTELLLDKLEAELATGLSTLAYDAKDTMVKAKNDEFGNSEGNDHHFHYSYYIRAAAVIGQARPEKIEVYRTKIEELIADIASENENSQFPKYRAFNMYESHSYADGDAKFGDGNNQESTSEALNAWYAVSLWGQVTDADTYQKLGERLFALELNAVKHYWFFPAQYKPEGFKHQMFSLVWGGKRDFATWFSGSPMHIYGIQWLPITPASGYLATIPNREAHLQDLQSLMGEGVYTHEWADLYVSYLSTVNLNLAKQKLPQISTSAGAKLRSLPWQFVYAQ